MNKLNDSMPTIVLWRVTVSGIDKDQVCNGDYDPPLDNVGYQLIINGVVFRVQAE